MDRRMKKRTAMITEYRGDDSCTRQDTELEQPMKRHTAGEGVGTARGWARASVNFTYGARAE
eukprot:6205078-Pleurochrysis_carterae.AAC.3